MILACFTTVSGTVSAAVFVFCGRAVPHSDIILTQGPLLKRRESRPLQRQKIA